jgi:predicted transposase YbfD/YdcC
VLQGLIDHFKLLRDPRRDHPNKLHKLVDIVVIVIWGLLANQDTWEEIVDYANDKIDLLKRYLDLPNGVPSHDTLNRTFSIIPPELMEETFFSWMNKQTPEAQEEYRRTQLDGKTLRGTRSSGTGKTEGKHNALSIVTVWSSAERLVLKQGAVSESSNEITAAREVLKGMDLNHTIVSMDAIHAQTETLSQIKEQGGEYVVGIKKNQVQMYKAISDLFEDQQKSSPSEFSQTFDVIHGREEERTCYVMNDLSRLKDADCRVEAFTGLQSIFVVEKDVLRKGKRSKERRFYLSSLKRSSSIALGYVRGHWSIENQQHYILDVTFGEDRNRTRRGFAARNLGLARRIVLNLLSLHGKKGVSMRRQRSRAAYNDGVVLEILGLNS